ncbi:hypothetical protein PV327_004224 [Microctonus hyperodae]|uniref:MIF4G domain-containing protein n=1 Tax=Microctonus hyperodae TaxID=165561 RepID=A0AA39KMA8_MICHY|nr:hypothetical protein PV327_004224 [Microctonus hyperodae]
MEHVGDGDGGGDRRSNSRGRGRESWGNSCGAYPSLRRPHSQVNNQQSASVNQVNEGMMNVSISDVIKNSELDAEAAEFVPRNLMPDGTTRISYIVRPRTSVQDRLTAARSQQHGMHQQHAQQHYPYGNQHQYLQQFQQMPYQQYVESEPQVYPRYDGYNSFDRNQDNRNIENSRSEPNLPDVLGQLNTAMQTLSRNPDQFENLVVPLVCNITPHLKIKVNTEAIVSAIILKCVSDANFRYSGARLCSHLDSVDTPLDDTPSIFRAALYKRCREETDNQALDWDGLSNHSPEDERKCHGLMLSLAELSAQMDTRPASKLGKLLIEVISVALENPGPNSAKYICQSLKLAGQYLERDSTNRQAIERIMSDLTELVIDGSVDAHVGRMVTSVKELRNSNWGRVVSSHGPTPADINQTVNIQQQQQQQQQAQQQFDEPVLYGPDGTVLSAEERRFCQDLANLDEGPDEPWYVNFYIV